MALYTRLYNKYVQIISIKNIPAFDNIYVYYSLYKYSVIVKNHTIIHDILDNKDRE